MADQSQKKTEASRRDFLKTSTAAAVGGSVVSALAAPRMAHAQSNETIKVGLIGCGSRGTGAANQALKADKDVKLTVMADMFPDKMQRSRATLQKHHPEKYAVTDENCFIGFDAYKEVMKSDVDVVLLCTPPHFRPAQLAAAVEAGKHIFCEKPVAVDAAGVRSVFDTVEKARAKNLSLVSGLCWRYDVGVRATIDKIKNGDIGDIVAIQENYLTGTLWSQARQPEWTDMEYQLRNWLYHTWLSGDHIVEQHIHSLDKALWLNDDAPPLKCFGLGGRQVRTDEIFGNIYDHHAVCYEFPNDIKVFAYTRQMKGTYMNTEDYVLGTKGKAQILKNTVEGETKWRFRGKKPSMYQIEHNELFAGIRSGNHINNGTYMTRSTMMAIMGRMACYTGDQLTWEDALNSSEDLTPEYKFGERETEPIATPGVTKLT